MKGLELSTVQRISPPHSWETEGKSWMSERRSYAVGSAGEVHGIFQYNGLLTRGGFNASQVMMKGIIHDNYTGLISIFRLQSDIGKVRDVNWYFENKPPSQPTVLMACSVFCTVSVLDIDYDFWKGQGCTGWTSCWFSSVWAGTWIVHLTFFSTFDHSSCLINKTALSFLTWYILHI